MGNRKGNRRMKLLIFLYKKKTKQKFLLYIKSFVLFFFLYFKKQLEFALNNLEQKQMEVCDVCGSFLIVNDAQSRVEEHVSGKQHMGYAKLRAALEEIRVNKNRKNTTLVHIIILFVLTYF